MHGARCTVHTIVCHARHSSRATTCTHQRCLPRCCRCRKSLHPPGWHAPTRKPGPTQVAEPRNSKRCSWPTYTNAVTPLWLVCARVPRRGSACRYGYRADRTRPDAACIITALVHGDHKYTHTLLKQTWPWRISDTPTRSCLDTATSVAALRARALCAWLDLRILTENNTTKLNGRRFAISARSANLGGVAVARLTCVPSTSALNTPRARAVVVAGASGYCVCLFQRFGPTSVCPRLSTIRGAKWHNGQRSRADGHDNAGAGNACPAASRRGGRSSNTRARFNA